MKKTLNILYALGFITVVGIISFGTFWLFYALITMLLENTIYKDNMHLLPQGKLRNTLALLLVLFAVIMTNGMKSDLVKAIISVPVFSVLFIAIFLQFYETVFIAVSIILAIALIALLYLYKNHKIWFYYYGVILSVIVSLAYGWPR
jgi:succinate-acetate transporter protein